MQKQRIWPGEALLTPQLHRLCRPPAQLGVACRQQKPLEKRTVLATTAPLQAAGFRPGRTYIHYPSVAKSRAAIAAAEQLPAAFEPERGRSTLFSGIRLLRGRKGVEPAKEKYTAARDANLGPREASAVTNRLTQPTSEDLRSALNQRTNAAQSIPSSTGR
jgi:hypothetical protein